ncbi:MAG: OmpH family outer membrane protein [Deltaproteobacteria bacterium]|nr:OmpH family outer membrane protein [Candidatus Zymogenaceae bacterium]
MKKAACVLAIICAVMIISAGAFAAETKFAVVNLQKVLELSDAGIKAQKEMDTRINAAGADVEKDGEALIRMREELENEAALLSAEAYADKVRTYENEYLEFQRKYEDYEYELYMMESELIDVVMNDVVELITEMSQKEGYTMVLESRVSGVLYADESIDITDEVIKALNNQ